ncbi:disulfide bond formation protein B [Bartonella sp. CB189]|uniref:disulfide bond formation protein B n=1 Tax=Bartonella sp. CB189 TaxID=3112254 RepID=UPI002F963222
MNYTTSIQHLLYKHLHLKANSKEQGLWAFFLIFCLSTTIGLALFFEHIGGYLPCHLCLIERFPYYSSIPFLILAILGAWFFRISFGVQLLFFCVFILMATSLVLGAYHAGIEYGFWPAPSSCTSNTVMLITDINQLLNRLSHIHPSSCSNAPYRFLWLSFAGWNMVSSFFYMLISFYIASKGILANHKNDNSTPQ